MKILIAGASGGLGSALYHHLKPRHEVVGTCFQHPAPHLVKQDLRCRSEVLARVRDFAPDLIVNTVALANVDHCEQDKALAFESNVTTAFHLRLAAEQQNIPLIHLSTSDIFEGTRGHYRETDPVVPVNFYGASKYAAEQVVQDYAEHLILRLTFLAWSASSKQSFASWLIHSLQQGQRVHLFEDQFNAPLALPTAVQWIEKLFNARGTLHLGSERASRYATGRQLAEAFCTHHGVEPTPLLAQIQPCRLQDRPLPTPRPVDVSLNCERLAKEWQLSTSLAHEIQSLVAMPEAPGLA